MAEILKQFRAGSLLSYIAGDTSPGTAVIVDPVGDSIDDYRSELASARLSAVAVFETQAPSERRLAAERVRQELKIPVQTTDPKTGVVGSGIGFETVAGSRPGVFRARFGERVFIGEDWQIGSGLQLPAWMAALPDETLLLPPLERYGILFSTVEAERKRVGDDPVEATVRISEISTSKYIHKIRDSGSDVRFLDVREPSEYSAGYIPGTINLPLSELASRLNEIRGAKRVYVSCQAGRRGQFAAQTLEYLGFPDVVNLVGGFNAWMQSGYPVEKK